MATVDDTAIAIADEYAGAALVLAERHGVADDYLAELEDFVRYLGTDAAFESFMESPAVDEERRREVLERVFRGRMNDLLLNTILVLNGKGRSDLLALFGERFRRALEQRRGEVEVRVTSAHPLSETLRERLTQVLTEHTGRKPRLVEQVDPATIAGVKVQIEDELLDNSAASHLRRMREAFLERAGRDLHGGAQAVMES
ncbi:MAG: ATP synthase F1 subunit delta [bacterium]|nr:ATP synthase F1 subunit delta [bacterium]